MTTQSRVSLPHRALENHRLPGVRTCIPFSPWREKVPKGDEGVFDITMKPATANHCRSVKNCRIVVPAKAEIQ